MKEWLENPAKGTVEKSFVVFVALAVCLLLAILTNMGIHYFYPAEAVKPDNFLYYFVFACVLAPLWEELAFRELPAKIAKSINPIIVYPILLLSAIIFGWMHGYGVLSLLRQGVTGTAFSVVYVKNGYSYWSAVAVHALWNLLLYVYPL